MRASPPKPVVDRLSAFGWWAERLVGHDVDRLLATVERATAVKERQRRWCATSPPARESPRSRVSGRSITSERISKCGPRPEPSWRLADAEPRGRPALRLVASGRDPEGDLDVLRSISQATIHFWSESGTLAFGLVPPNNTSRLRAPRSSSPSGCSPQAIWATSATWPQTHDQGHVRSGPAQSQRGGGLISPSGETQRTGSTSCTRNRDRLEKPVTGATSGWTEGARLDRLASALADRPLTKVAVSAWTDPLARAGNWALDLVEVERSGLVTLVGDDTNLGY